MLGRLDWTCTLEEVVVAMSNEDQTYLQSLHEADKMELFQRLPLHLSGDFFFHLSLVVRVTSCPWIIISRRWIPGRGSVKLWSKVIYVSERDVLSPGKGLSCPGFQG